MKVNHQAHSVEAELFNHDFNVSQLPSQINFIAQSVHVAGSGSGQFGGFFHQLQRLCFRAKGFQGQMVDRRTVI